MRVILLFVDGVGVGAESAHNPFVHARLPVLRELLGGMPYSGAALSTERAHSMSLDACLSVSGTPQSGTGQAALFTGENAPARHGSHFGPWVPVGLRELVRSASILARARALDHTVTFANAYPPALIHAGAGGGAAAGEGAAAGGAAGAAGRAARFLDAGPPLAAIGAGVFRRSTEELMARDAVASEIVNDGWRERLGIAGLPRITAADAGAVLAQIASGFDLTLFAHYDTDTAGHTRLLPNAIAALERVDEFIGGVVAHMPGDTLLMMVSDHGNIEDIRTGHTRNPALAMIAGRGHEKIGENATSLLDVVPMVLRALELPSQP
jgi:hypothetical protein